MFILAGQTTISSHVVNFIRADATTESLSPSADKNIYCSKMDTITLGKIGSSKSFL